MEKVMTVVESRVATLAQTELGQLRVASSDNMRPAVQRQVVAQFLRMLDELHHLARGMNGAADLYQGNVLFEFVPAEHATSRVFTQYLDAIVKAGLELAEMLPLSVYPNTHAIWDIIAKHVIGDGKGLAVTEGVSSRASECDAVILQQTIVAMYAKHPNFS